MEKKYISVQRLNKYIKEKFNRDVSLQNVYIKGEISNYRPHPSGHLYFTLKDEKSRVSAIMFASLANKLDFKLANGLQVLVNASVSVYEPNGQYQLYVNSIEQDGLGNLHLKFEQLKNKLEKEGLFDINHKQRIPLYPKKIAVLSAKQGDALQDILRTITLRFPFTQVIVFPIPVQGKNVYIDIVHILKQVDSLKFDTIIIGRGGGSIEDLWNFNEESLARCIYQCQTPIITGIGHETDFTICDFVSDYRGATPTAAAVKATPDQFELKKKNEYLLKRLTGQIKNKIELQHQILQRLSQSYYLKNPDFFVSNEFIRLIQLQEKLTHQFKFFNLNNQQHILMLKTKLNICFNNKLESKQYYLNKIMLQLDLLSPLKVMQRGYTLISKDGTVVKNPMQLQENDLIEIQFYNGKVNAQIK